MAARQAALMQLASQIPAAVLAEILHLHPTTAVAWVAAAGGDWNTYAAQIARTADGQRPRTSTTPPQPAPTMPNPL